jgi:hypothetical protein
MALTPGVLTQVSVSNTGAVINATKPSTGTAPFTYQLYRSTTTGFSPGPSNAVGDPVESSADEINFTDSGLTPGTAYFYKCIATEDGPTPDTATYTQIAVSTVPGGAQSQNQFAQSPTLGMIDLRFPYNTVSVLIDTSESGTLYAGSPVKLVDSEGGVPKVVGISANSDEVFGYINYDIKTIAFTAGMPAEISMNGNFMYLYATAAIARGARVVPANEITVGGVKAASGSTGHRIVGWAYDKATAAGKLIRVCLKTPSFELDS